MQAIDLLDRLSLKIDEKQNFIIKGISDSSKDIFEAWIFVAIKGTKTDGNNYIKDAIERGAKIIFTDSAISIKSEKIPIIKIDDSKKILSLLLKLFYSPKSDYIVAVTGTNGKSSTVDFYRSIFELLGKKSASIGTIGIVSNWIKFEPKTVQMTTPSISVMHNILGQMKNHGINYVSLEASSHGLDQERLNEINFRAAAFTSFSIDHLDYHESIDDYLACKLKIFNQISHYGLMIFNHDLTENVREKLEKISSEKKIPKLTYGKSLGSDLQILYIKKLSEKQTISVKYKGNIYHNDIQLIGEFQVYNLLAAIGLSIAVGEKFEDIWKILPAIKTASGRMEKIIDPKLKANIYIDYAHTEDALAFVLKDMRQYTIGKLKVLFGAGGGRDKNRRSGMGRAANLLADEIFVTDDNPRDEDPSLIRNEIKKFCPNAKEIAGRKEAIKFAVESLNPEDTLIIAGRGHEDYYVSKGIRYYLSDKEEVVKLINEN